VAQDIDDEVKRIIDQAYAKTREILSTYRERLDAVANRLIHEETIEGTEFEAMFAELPKLAPVLAPASA
jgi:cell division protease FtsH